MHSGKGSLFVGCKKSYLLYRPGEGGTAAGPPPVEVAQAGPSATPCIALLPSLPPLTLASLTLPHSGTPPLPPPSPPPPPAPEPAAGENDDSGAISDMGLTWSGMAGGVRPLKTGKSTGGGSGGGSKSSSNTNLSGLDTVGTPRAVSGVSPVSGPGAAAAAASAVIAGSDCSGVEVLLACGNSVLFVGEDGKPIRK